MPLRILVVDDSLTVRMDLCEALQEAGSDAVACRNLAEARTALIEHDVALIILDVNLPDGDGVDFLRELKGSSDTQNIPVLLLSTEAEVGDRIRGLTTGAEDYLGKPYDRNFVARRAAELLRDSRRPVARRAAPLILTIDDSRTFQEEMRMLLESQGYTVHTAATGEDGLRLAARLQPDAIIVDGILPGLDGHAVIRRLRSDPSLRRVPCVLLTGSDGKQDELQALEAGADTYARKDEASQVILARLAALLRATSGGDEERFPSHMQRMLAVDDDTTFCEQVAGVLKTDGYEVIRSRTGAEALAMLAAQRIDCVMLELTLADGSGLDVCRQIKGNPAYREIPVVVVSANNAPNTLLYCLDAGADDFVPKASDNDVLLARLVSHLRRRRTEEENRRIRQMAVAVRKNEMMLQALFEFAPDGIVVVDRPGRIVRINEQAETMFGYLRAELLGQPLEVLIPERFKSIYNQKHDEYFENPRRKLIGARNDFWARRKDGREFPIEITLGPIDSDEGMLVVGTIRDVTERQLAQEALRAKDEEVREVSRQLWLASRLATMGELAASIAHELNNPLTIVGLRLEALMEDLPPEGAEAQSLKIIEGELDRMATLVANLLQFSRSDTNQMSTLDLQEQVENTLDLISYHLKKYRVSVTMDFPSDLPLLVADRMKLRQVFLNVLVNAGDAMPNGGSLTIRAAASRNAEGKPAVVLEFVDTGEGIPAENITKVMEPFFTTKPEGKGTGLGLAICRRIMQEHYGSLELISAVGRGTTVRLTLPLSNGSNSSLVME